MGDREISADGKMKISCVKVNQIEFVDMLNNVVYQKNFSRNRIFAAFVLPKRALTWSYKTGARDRIAAGKQRDLVACPD
jgi:hypothetical protein